MKDMGAVSGLLLAALRRPHELPGLEREGGNGEAEMRLSFWGVFFSCLFKDGQASFPFLIGKADCLTPSLEKLVRLCFSEAKSSISLPREAESGASERFAA